ncbi:MAG TPA: hypothetical protein VN805_00855 [Caulobacteraceae bacterium]|nr:hypothetical protein [Caulobacteraceae bacterium]
MSAASDFAGAHHSGDVDRNLALVAYGLLFFAVFFAGAPALVAVAIAYARRQHGDPAVRSHFSFQIFVFWVGVVLTTIAALCGLGAILILLGEVIRGAVEGRWDSLDTALFTQSHVGLMMLLAAAAALFAVLTGVWLIVTSAYGFVLLATRHAMRQTSAA